nr:PLP-dependent aminotransferase family protein [Thermotogota bacterium]
MLLILLNKESKEPLYRQIVHRIAQMIESGKLQNDEMLPPTRRLAETLHVSRQTIVQAYEELWALGYLTSGSGSYTRVRNRMATVQKENRTEAGIDYERLIGTEKVKQLNQLIGRYQPAEAAGKQLIDMSVMNLDSSVFPVKEFQKSLNKVFRDYPDSTLNYGETAGYIKLREWISKRMRDHSTDVFPGEIILTNGISQGFELILKLFTSPGDTVFTESPGYRIANNLMKLHQLNIIEIPLNESGADLDQLEEGIKKCLKTGIIPKLFYTVPSFQNPTGILTSQKHRERLISIGNRYSLPIIEDSFEEEITYFDKKTLPIKSMDVEQIVFYLGTFSKVLFPGIRVGWIAGEKNCIEQMSILKKMSYMSGNTL